MPRHARIGIPGLPHHITQRGNNHQDVFFVDQDRVVYLGLLREQCAKHGVRVLAYCLMTNHIHLVATRAHRWKPRMVRRAPAIVTRWRKLVLFAAVPVAVFLFFICPIWRV